MRSKRNVTDKELIESLGLQQHRNTYFAVYYIDTLIYSQEFDSLEKAKHFIAGIALSAPHKKVAIIERAVIHTVRYE